VEAAPITQPRTSSTVSSRIPTGVAALAVTAIGLALGLHVGLTVDGAQADDESMYGLLPWLLYPGVIAIIAVRTHAEMLVTGLAAVVPIAAFATTYDRLAEMGIGVPLWYAALILVGITAASSVARRRGPIRTLASLVVGAVAVVAFASICISLLLIMPMNSAPGI
jgi:hypothetical protein